MTAPLSIVIPTLNAERVLPATLDTLLPGLGVIREVILCDGGSTDQTVTLARDAGGQIVSGTTGRGAQLRAGAAEARGTWLLFLHADTHLPPDWVGAVMTHIAASPDAAVFGLSFRADGVMPRLTAAWANWRTRVFSLPYGDQGMLISRVLYDAVGGYPDQPLMEDVAIARALRGRVVMLPEHVTTDAERYLRQGWFRRGGRNMWLVLRYLCGADPELLAGQYLKS